MKKIILLLFGFYCTNIQSQNLITDVDGNLYKTVKIGEQVWMAENLKVNHYRNGDPIPTNLSDSIWAKTNMGAYTIYNNDFKMDSLFGKLYNWYCVSDSRGLCPINWHVPSDDEWKTLELFLGLPEKDYEKYGSRGEKQNVGGKMKSANMVYWKHKFNGETNESGFSGLPGGIRNTKRFFDQGIAGFWWTSTKRTPSSDFSWYRSLDSFKRPYRDINPNNHGFSVRCIKD
jgi:uncharacterized protein (TIGR02145 family)